MKTTEKLRVDPAKKEGAGTVTLSAPVPPRVVDLISVDVETGGLIPGRHALLQIGAATASGARFERKLLPVEGMEIDQSAVLVNGYDPEVWLKEGVSLAEGMRDFRDWVAAARKASGAHVPLAHNAAFDRAFLDWAQERVRVHLQWSWRWECSMALMAAMLRAGLLEFGSCSLQGLCERAGVRRPEPHDALEDAVAALRGYSWLLAQLTRPRDEKKGGAA